MEAQQHIPKKVAKRGRPSGSTIFNRQSFLEHAIEAYRKTMNRREKHPSQYDVAEELLIARATLNRYLNTFGVSWSDIKQLATRLWPEPDGC
jgi:uncharacterized protein YqfB (UPF0267 family)